MKDLFNLLGRFSKSLNKDQYIKEKIAEVIEKQTRVSIDKDKIQISGNVLVLETSPIIKSEITLREFEIREELEAAKIKFSRILYR